jgi:hypothetical protein
MNPERIGKQIAKRLLIEQFTEKVSLYPGAFKPPHKGHVATVLKSIDDQTDRVIIFMSTKERDGVSVEEAQQVWDLYKQNNPELEKVEIVQTPVPVTAVYDYAKDNPTHDIRAVFGKGEEDRFKSLMDKEKYPHVEVFDAGMEGTYSATELRKAIRDNDLKTISEFIPDGINVDDFLSIFDMKESKKDYLQEARYKKFLNEGWDNSKAKIIGEFVNYCMEYLSVDRPKIKLINSPDYTLEYHSFGGYLPAEQKIIAVVNNRNMADILRTVAHEMVHHMQNLDSRLQPNSGEDGSPEENEANSLAGVIMRKFGRENAHIYEQV